MGRTTLRQGLSSKEGEGRLCGIHCHMSHTTKSVETKWIMSIFWHSQHVTSSRTIPPANTEALYKYFGLCQKQKKILYHLSLDVSRARDGFYGEVYVSQFSILIPYFLLLYVLRHLVLLDYTDCVPIVWNLVMLSRSWTKWKTPSGQDALWAVFPVHSHPHEETWPFPQLGWFYVPVSRDKASQTFRGIRN